MGAPKGGTKVELEREAQVKKKEVKGTRRIKVN